MCKYNICPGVFPGKVRDVVCVDITSAHVCSQVKLEMSYV